MDGLSPEAKREIAMIVTAAVSEAMEKHNLLHTELLTSSHQISNQLALTVDRLARVTALSEAHEVAIKGNGKVGLQTRVEQLENMSARQEEKLIKIDATTCETKDILLGDGDTPGIITRVVELERRAESFAKPLWIVISAALSAGVALLFSHFIK